MTTLAENKKAIPTIKGDTIGPWKLGETLGLGSTGKVQLAFNETTNQQAAIKIISKSIFNTKPNSNETSMVANTPDSLPYGIEREIIIMKLLRHANVLSLYDVWETNSNLYMILEYAEKGELFNLLVEKGPLPEKEAVRFFRQIIIGISYCHALGIVHRDLKPENLLLDHKFNIKIADFGMAALETEDKLLETSCGSPHYAAPEIVSGIPYHGFESDVWSCGVILFALLTGRLPFDEEDGNIRNLLLKVQSGQFEMPDDDEMSRDAQDLISRILTVDPTKRIKTREILKHPLLQKYPSIKDSKSIKNLPREDTYLFPLSDNNSVIDPSILQNLVVLWHGRDKEQIAAKLKESGANAEKTIYALLYRFKIEAENLSAKQEQVKRKQSIIKKSTANVSTPPRKKNRISTMSVSSSRKRPVSFNRLPTISNGKTNNIIPNGRNGDSNNTTPKSNKRLSINLSSNKRLSNLLVQGHSNGNSNSPTPSRSKRISLINLDNSTAPPIPVNVLKDYKNKSSSSKNKRASKRLTFLGNGKRGSITTKLLSTYAKLSEDDNWEYIEKETKRTSSDFATLIDEIFEHEKYEQIRKEKEELARKVREAKEGEARERREQESEKQRKQREREELERQQLELQNHIDQEISNLKADLANETKGAEPYENPRSVSAPLERENPEAIERDINDLFARRNVSLQTRPKSRLDPGILYSAPAETVSNPLLSDIDQEIDREKKILETIRRSRFLGSSYNINKELEFAKKTALAETSKKEKRSKVTSQNIVADKAAIGVIPLNDTEAGLRKISEIKVPQFTRKSRHFSNSNRRLSVLSMYSTKQSYTNLGDILKEGGVNLASEANNTTTSKASTEPEFQFESVNEGTANKLYELQEEPEYTDVNKEDGKPKKNVKLPTLPPLHEKTNQANGLAIYQSSSDDDKKPTEPQPKSQSMIPERQDSINNSASVKKTPVVEPESQATKKINKPKQRQPKKEEERKPLNEMPPNVEKKRNVSFFRKFSKSSAVSTLTKNGFDYEVYVNVSAPQLYKGLLRLLQGWSKYGLKDVKSQSNYMKLTGKLSNDNILSLRSTVFEMIVESKGKQSVVGFNKISGSSKTVRRLFVEIEKVLRQEGVLSA
ncbi:hypothetical protein NCAS_0B08600 [Naumovozyma castellii]|uniref:non-specific serine/threonine protein kinase n=1 Tax=Naumovozyma castellii TaxID=27288 RepID=G0VAR7_NAUCA|nr:hypothetical protein NCAS_0B08600 [Naumovozyma castellii CBS 4309]CCC68944.1 hypothetical protein NCAS_0B08600 [Naumovozyma castellii CBS 4309]